MEERLVEDQAIDLREYLEILWKRKWTILLTLTVVVGGTLLFSLRQTPLYSSTARLLVKGVPTDSSGYIQVVNLETESELVASEVVASRIAEDLGLDIPLKALINSLRVEPASEIAQVLEISFSSTNPELARDIPNSYASSYIEYKREQAQEALEVGRAAIEERLRPVQEQLRDVTRRLSSPEVLSNNALLNTLETERSALIARLGVLQQRMADFETREPLDLDGGEVIEAASLPGTPTSPNHQRNIMLAGFLGLIFGIGVALLRERLDDRLRGRADIERVLNAPVLATIPRVSANKKIPHELITLTQPSSPASEAYRSLRTNLQFLIAQQGLKSVLVTSALAGEGKTITAANLAVALAQAGQKVILISADLRRPTIEGYFGLEGGAGLSTWLSSGEEEIWSFIQDPGILNLRIIPSGRIPGNPAELLTSRRLKDLVETLEANSDLLLIDSPPTLPVADAPILASHMDGVLLVINANTTHRSAAVRAKEELERVGASLLGSIHNAFDPGALKNYYKSYEGVSPYTDSTHPKAEATP